MFTNEDVQQLSRRGITVEQATEQLRQLREGFPPLDIIAPASVKNGILRLSKEEQDECISLWRSYLEEKHDVVKFVPASGAASRMFKDLFAYLESGEETPAVSEFLSSLPKFAFGRQLESKSGQEAVRYLLEEMNYGHLPKGLLAFHKYRDTVRTPVLEHMVEGAWYAASDGVV
ncbi:MAG: DUF4301 family protein, partial [Paludibacteraceae bacterium]|nr:DUF4301 family protein [Paludibacteraceae bacterium]